MAEQMNSEKKGKDLAAPSTSKSNGWIWEHTDPCGDGLLQREGRCTKLSKERQGYFNRVTLSVFTKNKEQQRTTRNNNEPRLSRE